MHPKTENANLSGAEFLNTNLGDAKFHDVRLADVAAITPRLHSHQLDKRGRTRKMGLGNKTLIGQGWWMLSTRFFPAVAAVFLLLIYCLQSRAEDGWPAGFILQDEFLSPDGKLGVIVPTGDSVPKDKQDDALNILVDLKNDQRLAVVLNSHYVARRRHTNFKVVWAPDSTWCAVSYWAQYGFNHVTLVEIREGKFVQSDVGAVIQKTLDNLLKRESHGEVESGYAAAYFREANGRQVLVRGTGRTNPNGVAGRPSYDAIFEGTFDLPTQRWIRSGARPMVHEERYWPDAVYETFTASAHVFGSVAEKLKNYNDQLNVEYNGLRYILSAERFAALEEEQLAWMKRLEVIESPQEKILFMGERFKEFEKLAWE